MAFDLAGGYIGSTPRRFVHVYARLGAAVDAPSPAATAEVRRLMAGLGVTVVSCPRRSTLPTLSASPAGRACTGGVGLAAAPAP